MENNINPLTVVYLLAITVGLVTAVILWAFPNSEQKSRKLLSFTFIILTLNLIGEAIMGSDYLFKLPDMYKFGNILCFLFTPLSFLYIRSVLQKEHPRKRDLLHFLPFALVIIDYIPYLILPHEEKVIFLQNLINDPIITSSVSNQIGIIPSEIIIVLYHITFGIYWMLQIWMIIRFVRHGDNDVKEANKTTVNWLFFFCCVQFFLFYPYFINNSSPFENSINHIISDFSGAFVIILSAAYLFSRPELLYGLSKVLVPINDKIPAVEKVKASSTNSSKFLSKAKIIEIDSKLTEHIESNEPFLNQGYNLKDLSRDLDVPLYIMSSFINKEKGVNFSDFLNRYRIEYCKKKIAEGEWRNITLEGLGYDCGFSNRNSFTAAFKKFAGKTPSEFIKKYK